MPPDTPDTPNTKDAAYLWDIREAAREIQDFVKDISITQFLKDRKAQRAVERNLEILGEAARKLSLNFQEDNPDIPWRMMVAQRNVLAHEYGEIKQDRIWRVATDQIPDLIGKISKLIPPI